MKTKQIPGTSIKTLRTMGSWNDGGCIYGELDTGEKFKMPVSTVLSMVDEFIFKGETLKKYIRLTDPEPDGATPLEIDI